MSRAPDLSQSALALSPSAKAFWKHVKSRIVSEPEPSQSALHASTPKAWSPAGPTENSAGPAAAGVEPAPGAWPVTKPESRGVLDRSRARRSVPAGDVLGPGGMAPA